MENELNEGRKCLGVLVMLCLRGSARQELQRHERRGLLSCKNDSGP